MFRGKAVLAAAVALALALVAGALPAHAQKRIALLIGNQAYKQGVGALVNPLNDIGLVGQALASVGFEVLTPVENAGRAGMLIAVHDFAARLKAAGPGAVGFLYYSGHGIASEGENYLIPVDIEQPSTVQLRVQGVKQSEVLAILRGEAPNAATYLVLDACRNTLQGARGAKGFVSVGQQSGVLVAFSTEPGKTASDLGQSSGPYAAALAAELVKPGQSDLIMFHNVRVAVIEKTGGDQVPWTEDGIQRRQRLQFADNSPASPSAPPPIAAAPSRTPTIREIFATCIKSPRHPDGDDIMQRLAKVYGQRGHTYGWRYDQQAAAPNEVTIPVMGAQMRDGALEVGYDHKRGRLLVVPIVVPLNRSYAPSRAPRTDEPDAIGIGVLLEGMWI